MEREPYPSDLSDEQWVLIEPVITAWQQDCAGRSATGDLGICGLREVVNAIFYQGRTGCQWRCLPTVEGPSGLQCLPHSGPPPSATVRSVRAAEL